MCCMCMQSKHQTIQSNLSIWQVLKIVLFKIDNIVFSLTIRHIEIDRVQHIDINLNQMKMKKKNYKPEKQWKINI